MAQGVRSWSTTAADNDDADSTINWAENQLPGTVNNSARAVMAQIKRWHSDNDGSLTSAGSANAYTLTSNTAYTQREHGLTLSFKASFSNTGASTLAVSPAGGAAFTTTNIKTFRDGVISALLGGEIPIGHNAMVKYDSAFDAWVLLNPASDSSRYPLVVTDFGAVSGATTSHAAFQAAYDSATEGQQILVPPGTWNLTSATTQSTKFVRWKLDQGAHFDSSDAANAFTGKNDAVIDPVSNEYGDVELCASNPATQNKSIFYAIRDDSAAAIAYENQGLWVVTGQYDPMGGVVHDGVGLGGRGYALADDTSVYGAHIYALGSGSFNTYSLVGMEIDISNPASGTEVSGYSTYKKIGLAIYSVGAKRSTSAIEIGFSTSKFFRGLHFHPSAIDSGGYAIQVDGIFGVTDTGHLLLGKDTSDRDDTGVELKPDGNVWVSAANGSTATIILTEVGSNATGTLSQIVSQGKNSSGTIKSYSNLYTTIANSAAGSETVEVGLDGIDAGSAYTALAISRSTFRPGTDGVSTCGHASFRWSTVYATTGTINTSDATLKDNVTGIEDKVLNAWGRARAAAFQWKDAIEKKGDAARIHFGWLAQQVVSEFEAEGLDPWRYAPLCRDVVREPVKKLVKRTRGQKKMLPVYENGQPVMEEWEEHYQDGELKPGIPNMKKRFAQRQKMANQTVTEEYDDEITELVETGRYIEGLRPDQCLVLETAYLRRELKHMNDRLTRLEHGK